MSYSKISTNLANLIGAESKLNEEQRQVVAFAIENVFLLIIGFTMILIVGFLFNAMVPAATAAIAGGLLRRVSGGAHAKTVARCLIIGSISYGALGVTAQYLSSYLPGRIFFITGLLIALIFVSKYAPVDCAAKRIKSLTLRKKLKLASVGFVLFLLVLVTGFIHSPQVSTALTLGVLYQSITLIPIINKGGELNA